MTQPTGLLPFLLAIQVTAVHSAGQSMPTHSPSFQKGVGWGAAKDAVKNHLANYDSPEALRSLDNAKAVGVEWVQIEVTYFQDYCWSTELYAWKWGRRDITQTDHMVKTAINYAHSIGLKVMFNVHTQLRCKFDKELGGCGECESRSGVNFGDDLESWGKWFSSYRSMLTHFGDLCENGLDTPCETMLVYVEMQELPCPAYMWEDTIRLLKRHFTGKLAASVNLNLSNKTQDSLYAVTFWDQLDFIGIDSFPNIVETVPSVRNFSLTFQAVEESLRPLCDQYGLRILWTQVGFRSHDHCAWKGDAQVDMYRGALNMQCQCNGFEGLFDALWNSPYTEGMYLWNWMSCDTASPLRPSDDLISCSIGTSSAEMTFQDKPAQDLIARYYGGVSDVGGCDFSHVQFPDPQGQQPAQQLQQEDRGVVVGSGSSNPLDNNSRLATTTVQVAVFCTVLVAGAMLLAKLKPAAGDRNREFYSNML